MSTTITTTIRWEKEELNDVKTAAKNIGLPAALFIKSFILSKVRHAQEVSPYVEEQILLSQAEADRGEVERFDSAEDFLNNLRSHVK